MLAGLSMKARAAMALLAAGAAAALLVLWFLPATPAGSETLPPRDVPSQRITTTDPREFPTPPLAAPLPMASGPRTELPDNPASLPEGLVAPPDFADTIFGDDGEEDPAWVALRDQINDAMTTWSEEGLAVLQPLLSHPSARVRAEVVDAIIQMDLPAASPILRAAARRASSPAERRRLEQAAAFNDLPALSPQEVRQLLSPNASGGKPKR